jgi:serine phosphatase RsbU (regulator of sigma subunit)
VRSVVAIYSEDKPRVANHIEFPAQKLVDALLMDVQSYMGETPQSDEIALAVLSQESDP